MSNSILHAYQNLSNQIDLEALKRAKHFKAEDVAHLIQRNLHEVVTNIKQSNSDIGWAAVENLLQEIAKENYSVAQSLAHIKNDNTKNAHLEKLLFQDHVLKLIATKALREFNDPKNMSTHEKLLKLRERRAEQLAEGAKGAASQVNSYYDGFQGLIWMLCQALFDAINEEAIRQGLTPSEIAPKPQGGESGRLPPIFMPPR